MMPGAPMPPGMGPNGQGPSPEEMAAIQAVQPRPLPTAWTTRVVTFTNGDERKVMIEFTLLTPGGAHVTFWSPGDLSRMTSDLRSATKQASQEQSGIWTPGEEGPGPIIIPGR